MFEQNLPKNLYKLWNRMASGSYIPPPVKQVEIPNASGGFRKLGIPTVSDRIAQTAVKLIIEPILDPMFHPDSYGYRPGKSAKQAVAITRERCWKHDWVVEFGAYGPACKRPDHNPYRTSQSTWPDLAPAEVPMAGPLLDANAGGGLN